jgi:flagellar biosynthesis anti-sigma factor FlgM
MKIDLPITFPGQSEPSRVGATGPSPTQNQGELVGVSSDEVQLSVDGEKVQELKADLNGLPDLRQERVVALKQAIDEGSYKVSAEQIAQAMSSDLQGKA